MVLKYVPASLLVVSVLVNICTGFRWASKLKQENAEYVHITLQPGSERTKRSVDMPDNLHFRFKMAEKDMEVRLRRSIIAKDVKQEVTTNNFPLFVIENGTISREPLPPVQTAAVYENDTLGQLFVVRRNPELADYLLEGVFYDEATRQHHVIPDQNGDHWIHKQDMVLDYQGDYIDNTVPGSNKSSSTGQSTAGRHRRKRHTKLSRILGLSRNFVDSRLHTVINTKRENVERSARKKRQALTHYEIELFMVADFRDYREWLRYYNGNETQTALEMHIYYSFVANWISQRYRSIPNVDPTLKIDILTIGLLIVKSQRDSYWTELNQHVIRNRGVSVEAGSALESFRRWIDERPATLPQSDHWMLFTGFDIYTLNGATTNLHVAGLAKLGGLCTYNSVSIIEQDNTASVGATAAHELGHSLSARHDGELKGCKDEDNYIMSRKLKTPDVENLASRPWEFSPCSVRAFRHFLSRMKCGQIERHGTNFLTTELQGGQVFSADLQCKLALGKYSYFGRRIHYVDQFQSMCRRLFCAVPLRDAVGYYQAIFAMEKTTCGDGKWCVQGKCTPDISAPRALDDCPQGDWPDVRCQRHFCNLYPQHHRDIFCCKTCQEPQPVHNNFIYSLANAPVQIETVTRRVPALPGFEPPPTTPATTTTTTTTPITTTTTTIPQTSQDASTSPLTTTFSSDSTMNETTTQSMTSDTPRMTASVTSLSVENVTSTASSASTPASKANTTSSPVDPWEVPSKVHSSGNLTLQTSTGTSTTAESVTASTASTKSHTQNTPPSKTAVDVTSEGQDYLTTTSSVSSGSSRVTSSGNAAADPMTSKPTGHGEGSVVTTPSVTTENSGVTTNSSIQLDRSDHYLTTTPRNSMPETSENSLQPNVPSHTTSARTQDPSDASAGSQSSTEKPSSEHLSSSQDSLNRRVTESSVNLQTTSTTALATTESTSPVLKANTSNGQVDNGNTSRVELAQNSTFWDTNLHNSSKISTADTVPQNPSRKSAAENNLDVSFGKRDGSSMTSLSTHDTMDALEQKRQVTTSGTPSEMGNGFSKQDASSPQIDVVLSTPSSVQQSSADGLISSVIGKTSAPDSAGTYPKKPTLPPPGNEPPPFSPAEGKLNNNHPNQITGHESSPHPQSTASTPVDKTAQHDSLLGPLPPKELINQLLANASLFPLRKPQTSETSGDSSLGRSDHSSVSENSTVAPVSSSPNQLLGENHFSEKKPPSQSNSSTLVNGSFGSSGITPKSNTTTDYDRNGPHFSLFNSNKSEARNLQTTGGDFSESNDSVLLQNSSKAELTVQSSGSNDSVQVQNNGQTESILTSSRSNASVLIENSNQTESVLSTSGFNASVLTQGNSNRTESVLKSSGSNAFVATLNSSSQTEPILDPSGSNAFVATLNSSSQTESILDPSGSNAFVATLNSSSQTEPILDPSGSNAFVATLNSSSQTEPILDPSGSNAFVATLNSSSQTEPILDPSGSNAFVATLNSSSQSEPILDPSGSNAFVATLNSSSQTEPILDPSRSNASVPTQNSSNLTQSVGTEESQPSFFAERLSSTSSLHPMPRLGVSVHDLDKIARPLPSVSRFPNVPFIRFRTTSDRVTTWLPPTAAEEDPAFFAPPETSQSANQPRRCMALCQLFRAPTLNSGNTFMDGMSRFFRSRMETTFDRLGHERPRMRQVGDLYRLSPSGDRVTPVSRMDYLYPRRRRARKRRAG